MNNYYKTWEFWGAIYSVAGVVAILIGVMAICPW